MPDVFSLPAAGDSSGRSAETICEQPAYDLIELLFFAYRDFVGDADEMLVDYGFGRAHHRVLHFVDRNPGLRVRDLLGILKITKQSLSRVLRQLVEEGYIVHEAGAVVRREKLLFATDEGHRLAYRLAVLQTRRVAAATDEVGRDGAEHVRRFLTALVDPKEREAVKSRIGLEEELGTRASRTTSS